MLMTSCWHRSYLTDEERKWNPYKGGDILIFESSTQERDSIYIKDVSYIFPDGLGVVDYNQKLRVLAMHTDPKNSNRHRETFILTMAAKTREVPSHVVFDIRVRNTQILQQRYSFEELIAFKEIELAVPYGVFDDVICLTSKVSYSNKPGVVEYIFWSKSKGYIRFDKYDGTCWKLLEVISVD